LAGAKWCLLFLVLLLQANGIGACDSRAVAL
jgi:hypothetical protein